MSQVFREVEETKGVWMVWSLFSQAQRFASFNQNEKMDHYWKWQDDKWKDSSEKARFCPLQHKLHEPLANQYLIRLCRVVPPYDYFRYLLVFHYRYFYCVISLQVGRYKEVHKIG